MHHDDQFDQGITRRRALSILAAFGLVGITASCGSASEEDDDINQPSDECESIPSETEGPYPLSNFLDSTAIVRKNITEGKTGVPMRMRLNLLDVNNNCAALAGAAVYLWHCDKDGAYSGYSQPGSSTVGQTFLRGVQISDANGQVEFETIYPGWYGGRITHMHFQVFLQGNLNGPEAVTSQIAFPQEITQAVYNSSLYASRGQNTTVSSFSQDGIFADGVGDQLATVTGDISGYIATLTARVET